MEKRLLLSGKPNGAVQARLNQALLGRTSQFGGKQSLLSEAQ